MINKLLKIASYIDNLNKLIAIIARWSVLLMLTFGLWNVIGRYLGAAIGYNLSSNKLIEIQWYLYDVIFLLGLSWTLQNQGHVRVDILQANLSEQRKAKIDLLGTLILLIPFAFGVMMLSINPALQSLLIQEASPDPEGLPRYWVKSLIPLGFMLLTLQSIAEAIKSWAKSKEKVVLKKISKGDFN